MASLNTQSFNSLVQSFAAGVQARATQLIDFTEGAILLAVNEASAAMGLWLQALIVQVLAITRLATSFGSDVDSFVGDFGIVTRLGVEAATGLVTFARLTVSTTAPFIPVGTLVKTSDGTQQFSVYADPTNTAYSAALGGYTLAASVASVNVPVQALSPGSGGNVSAGAITLIASTTPGIDTVVNSAAFVNGIDAESDAALKLRFQAAILGLSAGDQYGTTAAILATSVGVQFTLTEDANYDGTYHPGFYFVVADDGSGAPPAAFLAAVTAAVQSVRPLSIQASVFGPTITTANVVAQIATGAGFTHSTVVAQVAAAVASAINGLGLGNGLEFYQIAAWILAVPGVIGVTGVTLNSLSGDAANIAGGAPGTGWSAGKLTTVKAGTLTIS